MADPTEFSVERHLTNCTIASALRLAAATYPELELLAVYAAERADVPDEIMAAARAIWEENGFTNRAGFSYDEPRDSDFRQRRGDEATRHEVFTGRW